MRGPCLELRFKLWPELTENRHPVSKR